MARPKAPTPAQQLASFMDEYSPDIRAKAKDALARLRATVPGATEMVYDTFNALVLGFCPGDRASEAILSIALYPRWVNLYFLDGVALSDPSKLLRGSGNRVRSIRLEDPKVIDTPAVKALISEAARNADAPFDPKRARRLVIKAIAPKRRPRRPL